MKGTVQIFGKMFEFDFLSGWIKYNRIKNEMSQEALAHGICSTSHLSFFENGKKKLRGEIIEALLKRLNIHRIIDIDNIGLIRQKFYNMMLQVELFDYDIAKVIYKELLAMEDLLCPSPYNIEYKIYQLMYNILVERNTYNDLKQELRALDKIYSSLSEELQYLYMLITGKLIYDFKNHDEGIERLTTAHRLKETPWTNYRLGVAYCHNNEHIKATYYLEKALESYERNGRYYNALWCHNFLGICYTSLKIYEKAEKHFKTVLIGSDYFSMNKNLWSIYNNLSNLYFCKEEYDESMKWSSLTMQNSSTVSSSSEDTRWLKAAWHINDEPILGACNYIDACIKLNRLDECKEIFDKYLYEEYESSRYYNHLFFLYLKVYHFEEEIFYKDVTEKILPYYQSIGYLNIHKKIKITLIEYLEKKRKYKEATKIYKELLF